MTDSNPTTVNSEEKRCPECGVSPTQRHQPGCDIERCPRCGGQAISCDCIYEVNSMDPETLEEKHPAIYKQGPTPAMIEAWEKEWGCRYLPWTGTYPGLAECQEFGWFARLLPGGWKPCSEHDDGATHDLNRLSRSAIWDAVTQCWVKRETIS